MSTPTDPVRAALAELESAEAHYRLIFQTAPTVGHLDVGRAWDRMKRAWDKARAALAVQPADPVDGARLRSTDRADVWAEEFAKVIPSVDRGLMIAWFANCAENAKDQERWRREEAQPAAPALSPSEAVYGFAG
jgi:hypothetical protein